MKQKPDKDELRAEVERGHFSRAAFLASSLDLPEDEIKDLQLKALWQMSAVYRNAPGTKKLADRYRLSKKNVSELLEKYARERRNQGDNRPLEPCYDHSTARYLSFEEWMDQLSKNWDKISVT